MQKRLIEMTDTQLLININNYLGTSYAKLSDVNWEKFFKKNKPFSNIYDKLDILERAIICLKINEKKDFTFDFLDNCQLSESEIDKYINIVLDNYPSRIISNIFDKLIYFHKVNAEQIKKMINFVISKDSNDVSFIITSLAKSINLTKDLLEEYLDAFSVQDWLNISKNPNLYKWYGDKLFYCSICTPYINFKNVLEYNYIPEWNLFHLFFQPDKYFTTKVLDLDDYLFIFKLRQFSIPNLRYIIEAYKNTDLEAQVIKTILQTQNLTSKIYGNLVEEYKELFIKYGYVESKNNWFLQKYQNLKLINYLRKNGFEIKYDTVGRRYVECYISFFYKEFSETSQFSNILNDDTCLEKVVPLTGAFSIKPKLIECVVNDKFYVYLQDIFMLDFSKSTFYTRRVNKSVI